MNDVWPVWQDVLLSPTTGLRPVVEGGQRLAGFSKHDSPEMPLVSYVTVVRNNSKTLTRTIESVLAQTYPNVEHIIIDGASTDGTLEIINKFSDKVDYYASEPDAGLYDALNKAIPLARGQLISVLNSDDWLEPDAAASVVRALRGLPEKTLILSAAQVDTGVQVITWEPSPVSLASYFACANCCHNAIYATRAAYETSGPYDGSYKIAADFKWIMRCLDMDVAFSYVNIPTVNYSLGGISGDGACHRQECKRLIRERFPLLTVDEADRLHYCYYLWRDRLNHTDVEEGFGSVDYILKIRKKYTDQAELIQALITPIVESKRSVYMQRTKNTVKKSLMKYPHIYSLVYKIHSILTKK